MRPTKTIEQCIDKNFTVDKIKTAEYQKSGDFAVIDQGKNLIAGYYSGNKQIYNGKLPTIIYGDHTNIVKYIDFPFICGADGVKVLTPKNDIYAKYFYYVLNSVKPETQGYRRHYPLLKNIQIPLPPLETQKAIVAKLDQIFAELDQTKSEIQKNFDNTDELWKSALNQAFQGDWEMKKLGEVAEIGPKKAEISLDENTKVSFVPMSDLSQEEMLFQTKNENTISELRKGSYTYFKNNDVLLAKVTPCFENGKCGIAKNLTNGIGFGSSEFIVFRPKDFIKSEFLYYFVSNKAFREEGAKNMGGAVGLQRVKKDWIENHNIPVPPLSEQEKIVEHLDQVSKEVKALKSQYQSQLDNLEELKKSVLDKAFRGEMG